MLAQTTQISIRTETNIIFVIKVRNIIKVYEMCRILKKNVKLLI